MVFFGFDLGFLIKMLPKLGSGLLLTLGLSLLAILGSLFLGIIGAWARSFRVPVLAPVVTGYVEFFRNTPLLVQIFFIYFGLPSIGLTLTGFWSGCLALGLWGGAYQVENLRAGLEAVPKGLLEAGASLGLKGRQVFQYIVLPVGLRVALPSAVNTAISTLKNSSYLAGIGVAELTFVAVDTIADTFRTVEMFVAIGLTYLVVVWGLSATTIRLESRLGRGEGVR